MVLEPVQRGFNQVHTQGNGKRMRQELLGMGHVSG
jgi:hypothetical protein